MTFTINRLTNQRAVVRGADATGAEGEVVLSTAEWDSLKARGEYDKAVKAHDEAITKFYAPVTEAAEKMQAAVTPKVDPITVLVLDEGVDSVPGRMPETVTLSHDSIVLRLIESGKHDRLVWVGGGLEVLAEPTAGVSAVTVVSPVEDDGAGAEADQFVG